MVYGIIVCSPTVLWDIFSMWDIPQTMFVYLMYQWAIHYHAKPLSKMRCGTLHFRMSTIGGSIRLYHITFTQRSFLTCACAYGALYHGAKPS